MSDDARRVALIAISSISVAALLAWYITSAARKRRVKNAKKKEDENSDNENNTEELYTNGLSMDKEEMDEDRIDEDEDLFQEDDEPEPQEDPKETKHEEPKVIIDEEVVDHVEEPIIEKAAPMRSISVASSSGTEEVGDEKEEPEEPSGHKEEKTEALSTLKVQVDEQAVVTSELSPFEKLLGSLDLQPFSWSEEAESCFKDRLLEEEMERRRECPEIESPDLQSETSEASSNDSGRATGGLASSLSPHEEGGEVLPQYEFEIPNSLVGLVIGVKGKTIRELSQRTDVKILIRPHHSQAKLDGFQICQVRGKRDQINKCLCMLRRRFPPHRFPDLNLQPVMPPPLPSGVFDALHTHPTWLTLPEGVPTEVVVSSYLDPGHVFLQQPTHPSFSSLSCLDRYMLHLYNQKEGIPLVPKPCETGLLCAAPVLGAWFRAVTVIYYPETDEVLIRFVDYGGYKKMKREELRQIRTDLMTLPFQAAECHLAHVRPVDGTWQWNETAVRLFKEVAMGKIIEAHVIGYHVDDNLPFVELTVPRGEGKLVRIDKFLMECGAAKAADPSKLARINHKKPSVSS